LHRDHRPWEFALTACRLAALLLVLMSSAGTLSAQSSAPTNPLIDYDAFAANVLAVAPLRESRRISEAQFRRMAREPGTVVLDARSERLFSMRHVVGAVNLSFPEFTEATLARVIPSKRTRVLIYCNNNFIGAPESLPLKTVSSALNVSTFVSLYAYGYRDVYELGPAIDVAASKLDFEGSEVRR
jgi:phage shock protein E